MPQADWPQGVDEGRKTVGLLLAKKSQGEVQLSWLHPAGLRGGAAGRRQRRGEGGLDVLWDGTGEEEAHEESTLRLLAS